MRPTLIVVESASLPAVPVEPEFREELEEVLHENESISDLIEHAVRRAVNYRRMQARFLARGEQAWLEYQRTGQSRSVDEVFDRIQELIDARRREMRTMP